MSVGLTAPARGYSESLRLVDARSFADAIASFGRSVPPRGRHQVEKEEFCLRRLLVALHRLARLRFPATIWSAGDAGSGPDFIVDAGDGPTVGVEVTTAGKASWHAWNARTGAQGPALLPADDGYVDDQPEQMACRAVLAAIARKRRVYDKYARAVEPCDLLIYENSEGGFLARRDEVLDRVRHALTGKRLRFAAVHVIFGDMVYLDVAGNRRVQVDASLEYADDVTGWAEAQARLLRDRRVDELDFDNIAEELESLGRSDRRALSSHMVILLVHLLKWRFQPARRGSSWRNSIAAARLEIEVLLKENPSFERVLTTVIAEAYARARRDGANEMRMEVADLPATCPFDEDDIFGRTSLEETPENE